MKKSLLIMFAAFLLSGNSIYSQFQDESVVLTLNLGYTPLTSHLTHQSLDGYSFNATIEKFGYYTNWAFGANLSFNGSDENYTYVNDSQSVVSISSTGFFLTSKYRFMKDTKAVPYIGIGVGVVFAKRDIALSGSPDDSDSNAPLNGTTSLNSFALTVPLGINMFISKNIIINANIAGVWTQETYYDSDIGWIFALGLGFQL